LQADGYIQGIAVPKLVAGNTFMYAETQVDVAMTDAEDKVDAATTSPDAQVHAEDKMDVTTAPIDADENALQPTIEQEGGGASCTSRSSPQDATVEQDASMAAAEDGDLHEDAELEEEQAGMNKLEANHAASAPEANVERVEQVCAQTCTPLLEEDLEVAPNADVQGSMGTVVIVEDEVAHEELNAHSEGNAGVPLLEDAQPVSQQRTAETPERAQSSNAGPSDSKELAEEVAFAEAKPVSLPDPNAPTLAEHSENLPEQPALTPSLSGGAACVFDVDVLLGNWVRDGGRLHSVQLNGAAGDSLQPGAIEFLPTAGGSPKPIVRVTGSWSLNGYTLDEGRSTATVLHWRHAASGAVRTWWRPGSKASSEELVGRGRATETSTPIKS
jgi:hypothetical protein